MGQDEGMAGYPRSVVEHQSSMNVLHVIDHLGLGGAQTLLVDVVKSLDSSRYKVIVCCLRGPTELGKQAEAQGLRILYLDRGKYDPRIFLDVARIIRKHKIQLVHTHLGASKIVGGVAAMVCRVRVTVVHDHGGAILFSDAPRPMRRLLWIVDRCLMRSVDKMIAVSQATKDYWVTERKIPADKVAVIYNGLDLSRFCPDSVDSCAMKSALGLRPSDVVVGTAGRLHEVKGQRYLLEAAAMLSQEYDDVRFVIIGDGPLREQLEGQAKALGIGEKVVFTGYRADIPELLGAMDVFVLPSLSETLGIACIEAMAMGKPVVATTVGGVPEVVLPGVTGLLVPPADSGALSRAIIELLHDPVKRKTFGQKGRARVKECFSIEATVSKIEALYQELWAARGFSLPNAGES